MEKWVFELVQTYGPLGLFLAMILQTVIVQIPSEAVVVFAGALGIDLLVVFLASSFGLFLGGLLAFWIGKTGGRAIIRKLIGKKWMEIIDRWGEKVGVKGILIARLIPLIPFDLISYLAGLTSLGWKEYTIATFIGVFPRCFLLSFLGSILSQFFSLIGVGVEIILLFGTIGLIVLAYLDSRGYIDVFKMRIIGKLLRKIFYV